ncbi:rod shape-determining protein RodA [Patescibacteria group bacterium]|nr:rod shape-determining protein RodA [Patescibacteria group bacterium]
MNRLFNFLKSFDWILFSGIFLLSIIGIIEIYSVALGQGTDEALMNFKKQVGFFILGCLLLFIFAYLIKFELLKSNANYIYFGAIFILIVVLLVGTEVRGTKGWYNFGIFGVQPVEFVKIALLIILAKFLSRITQNKISFKHFIYSGLFVIVLVVLVLLQPDFGSASILLAVWFFLLVASGLKKRYIVFLIVAMAALAWVGWSFYFKPYQKQRILTFMNAGEDSLDQGYNVTQAMIAVGSGQLYGRGIGFGSQSQLKFLPESQNDFIFAVIAEELGFFGVVFVISLFMIFFVRCYVNIRKIDDRFGIYFIIGSVILIFIEMFINIGMNLGIVPVVGISLPFISYGGSSMIANLVLIGIIENVIIRSKKAIVIIK